MNWKISFFCGLLILFLFSGSYGRTESEFLSVKHDFNSGSDSTKRLSAAGNCSQGFILNNDGKVCTGNMIELNSRNALTYQWSPADRFNNPAVQNPFVLIDSTRKYYLETTNYTNNLIDNPGFESWKRGFITDYTYCDTHDCLWPLGNNGYSVGTDAEFFHSAFSGHDHTTGSGNFMIVNGAQPSLTVWQQTITVQPNTQYAFGVWISTMIYRSPAQIQFSINGSQVGDLYNAPVNANEWDQVFTTWNSGPATSATIKIVDILPILEGNDFGLDDLFFGEVVSCSDSITLTASQNVNLGPDTFITPPDQVLEIASTVGPFDKYTWNTGESTQSIIISDPGKYWLSATDTDGCESADTITVKNSRVFVVFPNAFKPDAGGPNDFFRPAASNVSIFHMSVYNRWGQFMFETNDIKAGWDGSIKGEKCPAGLYVYVADYEFQDDFETKTSRGCFTLIR
jgi:gliding motility-associated-like protein